VWAALRDFNGLATWFSGAVSESHIENGLSGLTIGAVRSFQMGDSRIRERLRALSDIDRSYSYEFCEPAPFPVTGYLATVNGDSGQRCRPCPGGVVDRLRLRP
jgi:hypothetical protein